MAEDYYDVLGITRTASQDEIKKAFRKKAHQFHPDKSGGDEEAFKRVNEAYQVLGDEQKRSQYDQFGRTFDGAGGNPFAGGFQGFNINFEDIGDLGDVFSQFFGGASASTHRAGGRQQRRGSDIQMDVEISLRESAEGKKVELQNYLYQTCERCHGNGAEPGTPIETCRTCRGRGAVTQSRQTLFGAFAQQTQCPTCHGEGKVPQEACRECRGEGRTKQERKLEITIPAGIDNGQVIRISEKGETPARGGRAGDLFVNVRVRRDKHLRREGSDVRHDITVSFPEAALGTEVKVPTLKGEETLRIPAGTQPGAQLRLSGTGFPSLHGGGRGDQVVTVNVEVPKRLSRQQKQLLEEFKKTNKKSRWF